MKTIDFDCVAESLVEVMEGMASRGLDPKVIKWYGPGGGNPQLTITGNPDDMVKALVEVMEMDQDDAHFHVHGD